MGKTLTFSLSKKKILKQLNFESIYAHQIMGSVDDAQLKQPDSLLKLG